MLSVRRWLQFTECTISVEQNVRWRQVPTEDSWNRAGSSNLGNLVSPLQWRTLPRISPDLKKKWQFSQAWKGNYLWNLRPASGLVTWPKMLVHSCSEPACKAPECWLRGRVYFFFTFNVVPLDLLCNEHQSFSEMNCWFSVVVSVAD